MRWDLIYRLVEEFGNKSEDLFLKKNNEIINIQVGSWRAAAFLHIVSFVLTVVLAVISFILVFWFYHTKFCPKIYLGKPADKFRCFSAPECDNLFWYWETYNFLETRMNKGRWRNKISFKPWKVSRVNFVESWKFDPMGSFESLDCASCWLALTSSPRDFSMIFLFLSYVLHLLLSFISSRFKGKMNFLFSISVALNPSGWSYAK